MSSESGPLSFAQEQLWLVDQLRPGSTEYVVHRAWRLRGPLDTAALRAALTGIAERHDVLRTRYDAVNGVPVQVVDLAGPVPLTEIDLGEGEITAVERDVLCAPFDLRTGPPWRAVLARLGPDDAVLMIAAHHIAFDGWSWGVLHLELGALYAAHTEDVPCPRPEPAVRYADFAEWQRARWAAADTEAAVDWWRHRLAGLEPLDLPIDRRRPATWDARGDTVDFTIPADLAAAAAAAGRAVGATPFMTYLAAFQVLLARYTRGHDIAVGVSLAGRDQPEVADLVGLFATTVVLRTDLAGEPSFAEAIARVRAVTLDAFDHQDVPFDRVVAALDEAPDLSRNALFQAGFALHTEEGQALDLAGLAVTRFPTGVAGSPFDLSLHLLQRADGTVSARLVYPRALFERATVERLAAALSRLLAGAVADPSAAVATIDLVGGAERTRFARWNDTAAPLPDRTLPELFAAQAVSTPDAIAVVSGADCVTYADLADRVDGLAHHLRELGVGVGTPVGVCLPRGLDLVTALLAVLAAGGTYVPLPPEHPVPRLAAMTAAAGVSLAVANGPLPAGVTAIDPAARARRDGQLSTVEGADAAYILHTSGSTGRPKGVVITHAGIRNRVLWAVDHLALGPGERVLQKTTIGFDASLWEFLAPLVSGATLVMAPADAHRDPTAMLAAVARHGVTVLQVVPSLLRLLVEEPALSGCRSLRVVCSAGEPLPIALCARLTERLPVEIVNTYGPTECAIDATAWRYTSDETADTAPIGTPLPNTRVYVVDAYDRLVPTGVPGELCVSGVGLARGYSGRGDLTAERFTPDPYSGVPGARWYRTGDLVRMRDDGVLEFLGRLDRQVKVRGVRVEPGEVEAALLAHPSVSAAVVTAHEVGGEVVLVGHVVPSAGHATSSATLRDHIADLLPAAMVPTAVVALDEFPLTANGKLDTAALVAPALPGGSGAEPVTAIESAVARLTAEVLGRERVSVDDDFFALGGHSLQAIRLILRMRREFGADIAAGEVFTHRTARALAGLIDTATTDREGPRPVPRDGMLPLSPGQRRLWFVDRLDPSGTEYLVPLAMRLRGAWEPHVFRRAVDDLAGRHEVLRTRYTDTGGEPAQIVDPPGRAAVTVVDLSATPGDADAGGTAPDRAAEALRLIEAAAARPFDLRAEHPLRVTVVRISPTDHLVLVLLHHIAFDLWSTDLLVRELDLTYLALTAGEPAPLAAPEIQYADLASWQAVDGEDATRLEYWRTSLEGLTALELPTDRPRPAQRDVAGAHVVATIPAAVLGPVLAAGNDRDCTPFMTVLAAFEVLLARYTGRADFAVGTPVAGRTRPESEHLIGFFVNHLVLRANLSGDPGFAEVLNRTRRMVLAGMANQDVPFERVVNTLSPDRDLSRNPMFQVVFELEPGAAMPDSLGGAAVEPIAAGRPVAKFDLRLTTRLLPDGGLRCWFEYATALFDRSTIERMSAHFARLLESVGAAPDAKLSEVDLIGDDERGLLLGAWADPAAALAAEVDPPRLHGITVAAMVQAQVRRTPDATAVIAGATRLTYRELNTRANRLAHRLRDLGVGPEVVVGCCLERGAEAIVAWLAVMKSGGVYAPFDPGHPVRRLGFMLDDARARVVLAGEAAADALGGTRPVVTVDGTPQWAADPRGHDPEPQAGPDNLAYIIYTSGSTGRPKGVMIDHRAYAHHLRVITERYQSGPDDRVLLLSALTFDVAMDQIAVPLVSGATLIVGDPRLWTPDDLLAKVREHGVTTMQIPPSYYREIMDRDVSALESITLMNVGADVVTTADARRWTDAGLRGRFLYNYGPTEATVNCVIHTVPRDLNDHGAKAGLPLGEPLAGSPAYIVDADLRPVPIGVAGELLVGGVRLARGYHDRPELTAEKFVPDPFGSVPGARLYRTGDMARHRPDGVIQFLGRVDHQVKIRGFRIELGEIEAAIARHPDVRATVVVARDAPTGDKRLVAYTVPRADTDPDLRAHLAPLLPEYMVPAHWVVLPALPLTSSKKVDRKALPDPDWTGATTDAATPRTAAEHLIAATWSEVLGIPTPSPHDDFFHRGGHSLLATRVAAHLRDTLGLDLPLRLFFDNTTVATLANALTAAIRADIDRLGDAELQNLVLG